MTDVEYRDGLKELKIGKAAFARFLGAHPTTGKRWARVGPPPPAAKWVRYLIASGARPIDINAMIDRGSSAA